MNSFQEKININIFMSNLKFYISGLILILIPLSFVVYSIYNVVSSSSSSRKHQRAINDLIKGSIFTFIALVAVFIADIARRRNISPPQTLRENLDVFRNWYQENHPYFRRQRQQRQELERERQEQHELENIGGNVGEPVTNPVAQLPVSPSHQQLVSQNRYQLDPYIVNAEHLTFQGFYIYKKGQFNEYYVWDGFRYKQIVWVSDQYNRGHWQYAQEFHRV